MGFGVEGVGCRVKGLGWSSCMASVSMAPAVAVALPTPSWGVLPTPSWGVAFAVCTGVPAGCGEAFDAPGAGLWSHPIAKPGARGASRADATADAEPPPIAGAPSEAFRYAAAFVSLAALCLCRGGWDRV